MKRRFTHVVCAALAVASLALSGCSTTTTYAGRSTSILGGLVEAESKSYRPPAPTTVVVTSAEDRPGSELTGQRVSLLGGAAYVRRLLMRRCR